MKKFLSLLVVFTALAGFSSVAQAGLSFGISLGSPYRSYRHCGDGYTRVYSRPIVRYYDEDEECYRPRRRVVTYYTAPVYYSSRPRYYSRYRGCD